MLRPFGFECLGSYTHRGHSKDMQYVETTPQFDRKPHLAYNPFHKNSKHQPFFLKIYLSLDPEGIKDEMPKMPV